MGLSIGFLREPFGSDKDKILGVIRISGKKKIKKKKWSFGNKLEPKLRRIEENAERHLGVGT